MRRARSQLAGPGARAPRASRPASRAPTTGAALRGASALALRRCRCAVAQRRCPQRARAKASKTRRARRALRARWRDGAQSAGMRARCCWRTIAATRPRPCCCRPCAAPACRAGGDAAAVRSAMACTWSGRWLDVPRRGDRGLAAAQRRCATSTTRRNADTALRAQPHSPARLLPALEQGASPQFRRDLRALGASMRRRPQELLAALARADDLGASSATPPAASQRAARAARAAAPGQCAAPLAAAAAHQCARRARRRLERTAGPGGRLRHARPPTSASRSASRASSQRAAATVLRFSVQLLQAGIAARSLQSIAAAWIAGSAAQCARRALGIIPRFCAALARHQQFFDFAASSSHCPSDGTDRSQVRRHVDGLDRAHPQRRQARRQVGARRPPDGRGARRR